MKARAQLNTTETIRDKETEGKSDEERRALRRALRKDPRCARAWIHLGALEAERGRSKRALAAWRKALAAPMPKPKTGRNRG